MNFGERLKQIRTDKSLRIYGFLNWLVAGLGSAALIALYNQYFGH